LLSIKAELENVTNLVPASDGFEYFFKVLIDELARVILYKQISYNLVCRYNAIVAMKYTPNLYLSTVWYVRWILVVILFVIDDHSKSAK
jgi:hypothetical protein